MATERTGRRSGAARRAARARVRPDGSARPRRARSRAQANIRYVTGAPQLWIAGTRPFGPMCVVVRATGEIHLLSTWDEGVPDDIPHENLYGIAWNPMTLIGAPEHRRGRHGATGRHRRAVTDFRQAAADGVPERRAGRRRVAMRAARRIKTAEEVTRSAVAAGRRTRPGRGGGGAAARCPSSRSPACSWRRWPPAASPHRRPRTWPGSRRGNTRGGAHGATAASQAGDLVAFSRRRGRRLRRRGGPDVTASVVTTTRSASCSALG